MAMIQSVLFGGISLLQPNFIECLSNNSSILGVQKLGLL